MSEDMDYRPISEREDADEVCTIWLDVNYLAGKWEDDWGCTRKQVIEALTYTLVSFTLRRQDQVLMQKPEDRRRFLQYIVNYAQRELDQDQPNEVVDAYMKEVYGGDLLYWRNAKNFGYIPPEEEGEEN